MEVKQIYLCYCTDEWLSETSRKLLYVGGMGIDDCIAQLQKYCDMTEEQAEQIREMGQSQCNGIGYEFIFDEVRLNCFVS